MQEWCSGKKKIVMLQENCPKRDIHILKGYICSWGEIRHKLSRGIRIERMEGTVHLLFVGIFLSLLVGRGVLRGGGEGGREVEGGGGTGPIKAKMPERMTESSCGCAGRIRNTN